MKKREDYSRKVFQLYRTWEAQSGGKLCSLSESRAACPGGRVPPSFIHQEIIITGRNKLYVYVWLYCYALKITLDADRAEHPHSNSNSLSLSLSLPLSPFPLSPLPSFLSTLPSLPSPFLSFSSLSPLLPFCPPLSPLSPLSPPISFCLTMSLCTINYLRNQLPCSSFVHNCDIHDSNLYWAHLVEGLAEVTDLGPRLVASFSPLNMYTRPHDKKTIANFLLPRHRWKRYVFLEKKRRAFPDRVYINHEDRWHGNRYVINPIWPTGSGRGRANWWLVTACVPQMSRVVVREKWKNASFIQKADSSGPSTGCVNLINLNGIH